MQTSIPALITILGMALITYLTRIGGLLLLSRITLSKRLRAWLDYLPGTVLVAIVAPTVLSTGLAELGASLLVIVVAIRTKNMLLALLVGVFAVWLLRLVLPH